MADSDAPRFVALRVRLDGGEPATIVVEDRGLAQYRDRVLRESLGIVPVVSDPAGSDLQLLVARLVAVDGHHAQPLDGDTRIVPGKVGFTSVVTLGATSLEIVVLDIAAPNWEPRGRCTHEPAFSSVAPRLSCGITCRSTQARGVLVSMPCGTCSTTLGSDVEWNPPL
jgi:hypothetical protein